MHPRLPAITSARGLTEATYDGTGAMGFEPMISSADNRAETTTFQYPQKQPRTDLNDERQSQSLM